MSENKFTPGPWSVEPHGKYHALYSGRDDNHHGLNLMIFSDGDSNFESNITLIAADPELLAVVEAAFDWIDAVPSDTELPTMPGLDRDWTDAVIAKARGESN